jgi:hypothetical protein
MSQKKTYDDRYDVALLNADGDSAQDEALGPRFDERRKPDSIIH